MDQLGDIIEAAMVAELVAAGKQVTSVLVNSFRHEVNDLIDGIEVVGTMVFYGRFVETGRKPGTKGVPIGKLMEWIKTKRIENDITKIKSIAFAMQKGIIEKGIKPLPFITTALAQVRPKVDAISPQVLRESVTRQLDTIFKVLD